MLNGNGFVLLFVVLLPATAAAFTHPAYVKNDRDNKILWIILLLLVVGIVTNNMGSDANANK